MLERFECEGFRCFKDRLVFDLTAHTYEFNPELVKNGVVKNALIYGQNGVGKSSLGMAIFDIIAHLTDNNPIGQQAEPYLNLDAAERVASFKYVFKFSEGKVTYQYEKSASDQLVHESLWFGERERPVIDWNYVNEEGNWYDKECLGDVDLGRRDPQISLVKYAYRTFKSEGHVLLCRMMVFVERMLWFRRLSRGPTYAGFQMRTERLGEAIIQQGKLAEFGEFLHRHGIDYSLYADKEGGHDVIKVQFANGAAPFRAVASSGTINLELFFYWSITAFSTVSLLFIDEYDVFFHYASSRALLEMLNHSEKFQIFLTTHNTYLMQNGLTRPDACYLLTQSERKSPRIAALCDATDKEIRFAHNLEKMYTHGVFRDY